MFSRETETGEAAFVGKYNFNNDKSTQEVFGFEGIDGCNANLTNRTDIVAEADDYRTSTGDINSKSTINPCECWEFKTNDLDLCKFKFNSEDDLTRDNLKMAFESRYPEEYAAPSDTKEATMYEDTTWGHYELKKVMMWVHATDTKQASGAKLSSSVLYNGISYLYDTVEYRLAKFKAEVSEHFNLNNLLSYFILTDFLGAVDQRAKNQMMASWGNEGAGDFKWYFIFYDNDTILGINNVGKIAHDYDLESDTVGGYSGKDSVLWLNLEACFYDSLCACWGNLISAVSSNTTLLSYENLINEFNVRQCDQWSESVFNEDSNYKYVYQGGATNKDTDYYTVLQGSRAEHRKYWIDNRLQWTHGKYKSKSFLAEGTGWRCNKVSGVNASESLKLTIHGARKQYFGYIIGNTTNEVFLLNEGDSKFCEYTGGWDYTNLNLAGEEYITDFGDISHQLPSDVKIAKMTRLKKLVLSSEPFKNTYLLNLSLTNKPFLEYVDISYATNLSALTDAGECYRLKTFLAYQSGLRETPFADGADIEYAELPKKRNDENGDVITPGIAAITLKNLPYLTFDNLKFEDGDYSSVTSLQIDNCPGIMPLKLFDKVCNNEGLSRVVLLNINETVKYSDTILENLVKLATSTQIPSAENRITGEITTDNISNLHLGILENKYIGLKINYNNIISSTSISITSNNILNVYEGKTQQLNFTINGDNSYTEIEWSIVSGNQYASISPSGLLTAIEQRNNRSYKESVVIRATLKASRYVYTDYEMTVEGVAATGGVIEGDTWLSSKDASIMPSINNNSIRLIPSLCTKRISNITWHKNPTDPNYGMYEIDSITGDIQFTAVKTIAGMPTFKQSEFTVQIYADFQVFETTLRSDKILYIDYPNLGDYVYHNGSHSSTYYTQACEDGTLTLIGLCYYVSDDRTDRRMVATRNGTHGSGLDTCVFGVYGFDLPLINKNRAFLRPDGTDGPWGNYWKSYFPNGIDLIQQQARNNIAMGDMDGKTNTDCLISERESNGYPNLNSFSDITNNSKEYPAAAYCRLWGDNSWAIGKKGEWWLPSAGEVMLLYQNFQWNDEAHPNPVAEFISRLDRDIFRPISNLNLWSSTEVSDIQVVIFLFSSGTIQANLKTGNVTARPVSSF